MYRDKKEIVSKHFLFYRFISSNYLGYKSAFPYPAHTVQAIGCHKDPTKKAFKLPMDPISTTMKSPCPRLRDHFPYGLCQLNLTTLICINPRNMVAIATNN